jgi:hypothetical protein
MKGEIKFRKMGMAFGIIKCSWGCNYWSWGEELLVIPIIMSVKRKDVLSIYLRHQLIPYSIDWLLQ